MTSNVHNNMAQAAYAAVTTVSKSDQKEFRSLARSFPSMLQTNGLCAAIAFLNAKKEGSSAHRELYQILTARLKEIGLLKDQDLLERILELDNSDYRLCTDEVMNFCLWIKRFAEGMSSQNDIKEQQPEQAPAEHQQ